MQKQGRIKYIPFISSVAAIAVLFLHTNGCFWVFSATEPYWKSANIIECFFYPAVPLFFMISGITLMDFYDRSTLKEYFVKRINKTFVPFVAWSLIVLAMKLLLGRVTLNEITIKYLYEGIIGSQIVSIFWFFAPLFCIYLSMPLFAAVEKTKRKEVFSYLVIIGFVLNLLVPFVKSVFNLSFSTPYQVTVVTGALIWVPLGWLLHNCEFSKTTKAFLYVFAVAGLLSHIIGTYKLSMDAGRIVETFKGYQNVPCVMHASGLFVLLKDVGTRVMKGKTESFFNWLSTYAFPIYLMQFIFLVALPGFSFVDTTSLVYRLGAPFLIVPIIIAVAWIIRKIPFVNKILP